MTNRNCGAASYQFMRFSYLCICFLLLIPAAAQTPPVTRVAPFSAPGMETGVVSFVNASDSPVGATTATGQNVAGAADSTIGNVPGVSAASVTVPVYVHAPTTEVAFTNAEMQAALAAAPQPGTGFVDILGVMQTNSAYAINLPPNTISVAEAAREARQREAALRNVRAFTNADVQQLAKNPGVTQPAGFTLLTVPNTGGTAGAASQPVPESQTPQATAPAAPTEPPAPQASQEPSAQGQSQPTASPRLPATASLLPLLALGAALAGGIGILLRRLA